MVWSEAETLRSNLNDVTQQFVVTYTAEQQQACLDRAQVRPLLVIAVVSLRACIRRVSFILEIA